MDAAACAHLREQIHPQAAFYADAPRRAGYPPSLFFSRAFTIDTGQIVNQGRAQHLFRGLTENNGEPMTPREERGFGQASLSTVRGPIWRITHPPAPHPRRPPADRRRCRRRRRRRREEEPDHHHAEPAGRGNGPLPPLPHRAGHRLPPAPPHAHPAGRLDRAHHHDGRPDSTRPARPARRLNPSYSSRGRGGGTASPASYEPWHPGAATPESPPSPTAPTRPSAQPGPSDHVLC